MKAILSLKESQNNRSLEDQQRKIDESFSYIDKYEVLLNRVGYKYSQIMRLLQYSQILSEDVGNSAVQADIKHVELAKGKLQKNA
jgi:hypothetical protein